MRIADLLVPQRVRVGLVGREKLEVLEELSGLLASGGTGLEPGEVCRALLERERLRSTGVGGGVAVPHGKVAGLPAPALAVGLSAAGVEFGAADEQPVHIFMALVAPQGASGDHLRALARIARLCADSAFRARLLACSTDEQVYEALVSEDSRR